MMYLTLLWTGRSSSVSSLAFLGLRELKQIEKAGGRLLCYVETLSRLYVGVMIDMRLTLSTTDCIFVCCL